MSVINYARVSSGTIDWVPRADLRDEETRYVIDVDLPGVASEEIDLTLEDGLLTVAGHRQVERAGQNGYRRIERRAGKFQRRFSLPDAGAADQVSARNRNGVLEIVVPKDERVLPRRINIRAA